MFASRVYWFAGIYGLIVLLPQYLLEKQIGIDTPPAITHPEFFYGFLGTAVAWQVAFLVIARDPQRYRPLMLPSLIEKFSFGLVVPVLFALGRISATVLVFGLIDLLLGVLFVISYQKTRPNPS